MMEYIILAATAWFMGFFPLFEVYLAIPASMGLGLDMVSSIIWAWFGNFFAIPFIAYSYDWLTKFKRIQRYFYKLTHSKTSQRLNKGGFMIVLLGTPLFGSWAIGVIGKVIGMDKKRLFLSSAISIGIYGIIIGVLTQFGIDLFS